LQFAENHVVLSSARRATPPDISAPTDGEYVACFHSIQNNMSETKLTLRAGEQLKDLRVRLGITTRDVADLSQKIIDLEKNQEFRISNTWLSEIENSESVPSIYKLYSLSIIYHVKFADLLQLYGVDVQRIDKLQLEIPLPQTHLTPVEVFDETGTVTFPVHFDSGFNRDKTNLLSRMVEIWGEVPIAVIRHLDVRHSIYGYIGLEDRTLYPLLRPGSFVQIDPSVKKVLPLRWQTEYERPIYFVELRDGYVCSWCEQQGSQLILIPHLLSGYPIRQFKYETEAEIVGRVTGLAMRIVGAEGPVTGGPARLPRRP
jgi:transcriptional regulator with XRE-family HTH domain